MKRLRKFDDVYYELSTYWDNDIFPDFIDKFPRMRPINVQYRFENCFIDYMCHIGELDV